MDTFAESSTGLLLIANGLDPMLRWDGLTDQAEPAGIPPPAAAPTMGGSGKGGILGTYYAFVRFVDRDGNLSNLSPLSAQFVPNGGTGTITDAAFTTPITVTSPAHGLTTGAVVQVVGVGGNTSANNTWTVQVLDANTFYLLDSTATGTYTGGGTWTAGVALVTYTNVEAPSNPRVARRQILRNTDGQTQTFYVDIDTADLTSTTLRSPRVDADLSTQEAQAILDSKGDTLANRYDVPPAHKAVVAQHQDRMFAAAQVDYAEGSCQTTFGSATVAGVGTAWTSSMVGRFLYVVGAKRPYEIATVDTVHQTLTLTANYADATDLFALYAIRPAPAENRLVYYSEAGLPEAWPPTNALSIQEDGDDITGLVAKGSFLYVLERRHIYRLTFQNDPATDGAVFLSAVRGCVNQHCWVVVESTLYMLDEQGIHAFAGSQESESISTVIQEIFRPNSTAPYQINWAARKWFHAVHYPPQETIRWFVALSGSDLPRHALCYQYRLQRWWIEEFKVPIGASATGEVAGRPEVFLGSTAKRVFAFWEGTLDGPDPAAGTVRGQVTAAAPASITDGLAAFAASGLVGSPVSIVDGRGKGQTRIVTQVSSQTLLVNEPWLILPDTTSVYQLGGIEWKWASGHWRLAPSEDDEPRRVEVVFRPAANPAAADLRIHFDFAPVATPWGVAMASDQGAGVASNPDDYSLVIDLTKATAVAQKRLPGHKELHLDGRRFSQVELTGFTNQDPVSIWEVSYDGVVPRRE